MRPIKFLLICVIALPYQLTAQSGGPGALLPSFAQGGIAVSTQSITQYQQILPLANGKLLIAGRETASHAYPNGYVESATFSDFWRYNSDGTLDLTYGASGERSFISSDDDHNFFTGFGRLSDGSIVAIETYGKDNNFTPLNTVWKFNSDGTGGTIIAELSVFGYFAVQLNAITVDDQDRIVVTGIVVPNSGTEHTRTYIARLLADGTPDESFFGGGFRVLVENSSYNYSGEDVITDRSNNIILMEHGFYGTANGYYMSKFLENGSRVTAFGNINTGAALRGLFTDTNSKIIFLVGASIKRLNTDGALDKVLSSSAGSLTKIIIQPDNKIVGIARTSLNGHDVFQVFRYTADGNSDQAFGGTGSVTTDLILDSYADDVIYVNRRLYVSGTVYNFFPYGMIAAYDASDVRMTCPTLQNPYNVDAGKCYATINGINAVMSSSTLWANVQNTVVHNGITTTGEGGVAGQQFQLGTTHVTYSYTDITTQTCSFDITVTDNDPPVARCKNVTVQLDANGNGTLTAAQVNNGSTDGCGIGSMSLSKTAFTCSDAPSITDTLTVYDIHGNSSTCTATVTIEDNVPPDAKCKSMNLYLDAAGNASITAAQIDDGSTDACGIKSISIDKTTFNCSNKGNNTVVLTVTDNHDNTATCSSTVTVLDTIPPIISAVVPSPQAIFPSDRKMKNVSIATSATDNCVVNSCMITGVAIKSGEFANDNIGPDWEITGPNTVNLRAEIPKKGVKRIYTVTVTCTDASNNSSTSSTDVIVAHNITAPISGATVRIGSTVNLAGEFWDVPGKKHTAKWLIDDKTINGSVTEPSGMNSGVVKGSYKFSTAGVYKLQMNVTDQNGITTYSNTSENLEAIVVVYDPDGGYTFGGGWFNSAAGALKTNTALAGDVSYGFTVNYYKSATFPKGETQFDFQLGDFEYNALNFDYLSINKATAQFKGTGKITGGQSGVNFIMTVTDGELDGTGTDKIRIKIYNKNTGEVYYDNQPGASDAAAPVTGVGINSNIVISSSSGVNRRLITGDTEELKSESQQIKNENEGLNVVKGLELLAFPNPARTNFTVRVISSNSKDVIRLQILNVMGTVIESRFLLPNQTANFGNKYRPGSYYIRVMQGKEQKQMKLIKLSD